MKRRGRETLRCVPSSPARYSCLPQMVSLTRMFFNDGEGDRNYTPALQGFDLFESPKTPPGESNRRDVPESIYFIHGGGPIGDSNKWRPPRGGGVVPGKGSAVNQMYTVSVDTNGGR